MRCMNPKLLAGIVVVGIAVAVLAPGVGRSVGPLLILAACPVSMIVMMTLMGRRSSTTPEHTDCGSDAQPLDRRDAELAELRERLARLEGRDTHAPGRA